MKACVSASADSLDAPMDPSFPRCRYFIFVDLETMKFEAVPNAAAEAPRGAGALAAQIVKSKGANVVITGNIGPHAMQILSAAGIKVFAGAYGTVREAIEKYKRGELKETTSPTVGGRFRARRRRGWRSEV